VPVDPFIHPCWYAIQTHSWYEKRVRDQLTTKAITTFLPLWQQRRRWTDRVKLIELPLFRSYRSSLTVRSFLLEFYEFIMCCIFFY
jgi:hypothetical protein